MITADDACAVAAAERYNLKVVDLTAVDDGKGNHHSKYSKSAPVIAIGSKLKNPTASSTQVGVVTAVTNAGDTLLKVPASILPAANAAQ